jgi:hypothetical protein
MTFLKGINMYLCDLNRIYTTQFLSFHIDIYVLQDNQYNFFNSLSFMKLVIDQSGEQRFLAVAFPTQKAKG